MKKLGEILVENGVVTPEQLEQALQRQKTAGGRLGTNLVEMMLLDDVRLGHFLSQQAGIPPVHPRVLEVIDPKVLEALPLSLVENYYALPFKLEGRRLHVVMLDPTNIQLVDDLSHRSGYIIKPYICAESVLFRALSMHYRIPPPIRVSPDQTMSTPDMIVHDTAGIISLDDEGQFTLVDRADILSDQTKKLFLDAPTRTAVVGYFLQFLAYNCDKVAFLAYDRNKNYLWRDAQEFQSGKQGIACGTQVERSTFWRRYLSRPGFFYTRLPRPGNEMGWVNKMLDMTVVKALFLAPLAISKRVMGVAIGGSSSSLRLEEEIDTIKKLHLIAVSALKIQEFRRIIENIS